MPVPKDEEIFNTIQWNGKAEDLLKCISQKALDDALDDILRRQRGMTNRWVTDAFGIPLAAFDNTPAFRARERFEGEFASNGFTIPLKMVTEVRCRACGGTTHGAWPTCDTCNTVEKEFGRIERVYTGALLGRNLIR